MLNAKMTTAQFEECVRPVFPVLAQLVQNQSGEHADPQVQQGCCECWRRALDLVVIHYDVQPVVKGWGNDKGHEKGRDKGFDKGFDKGQDKGKRYRKVDRAQPAKPVADLVAE